MIEDIFDNNVINYMRDKINSAKGREVFFVGSLDDTGIISGIKSFAKGNGHSVPVVFNEAYKGDCVIHNHPTGNLEPSNPDLQIASKLANDGIGFLIVNNEVSEYYAVIENIENQSIRPLDSFEILKMVSNKGDVAIRIPNFEQRESQEMMLETVIDCFNNNSIGLIEAGTGTGKSIAYLIPAIKWAVTNKEKVVISTNTINLQQQLMRKDIPLLKEAIKEDFTPVLVKGASNYICLRKLDKLLAGSKGLFVNDKDIEFLENITEFVNHKAKEGSKDELGFIPDNSLWEKICVETDLCTRSKCPSFSRCFFFKARKSALKGDILIVNHHLLCSDIAIRKEIDDFTQNALLPYYSKLIIDEAHNLEDVATSYFGNTVTRIGLKRVVNKLYRNRKGKVTGVLALLLYLMDRVVNKSEAQDEIISIIEQEIKKEVKSLTKIIDAFFDTLFDFTLSIKTKNREETKIRLKKEIILSDKVSKEKYIKLKEDGKLLAGKLLTISESLKKMSLKFKKLNSDEKEEISDEIKEIYSLKMKLNAFALTIEENLSIANPDEKVYWVQMRNREDSNIIRLSSCPLEVADFIRETIFQKFNNTVVLTSATLTVNSSFEYFKKRIGLDTSVENDVEEKLLPSPFDYANQMSICIPMDIVEPQSNKYLEFSSKYVERIIEITQGSTFLLFTSFYAMDYTYRHLLKTFGKNNFTFLKQGTYDRHTILTRFRNSDNAVLLGTDSFWEGVDVSGDSLKCVVLMKLPFRVPTEPIIQARIEKMERIGMNSFMEYTLPQTVIKFRQGFGRLIRSKTDTGCVVCLDRRIATKLYGKVFLKSLPPARIVNGYYEEVFSEIRRYF